MVGRRRPNIAFVLRESLEQAQDRFEQHGESPGNNAVYIEIVAWIKNLMLNFCLYWAQKRGRGNQTFARQILNENIPHQPY
jgi:hypothetical protein